MMEFYAAFADYRWLMDFTEELIRQAAISATGSAVLTYQERELDLSKPFDRLTICEAILTRPATPRRSWTMPPSCAPS